MLDFVFVVLVYRNTSDLRDFFKHCNINNSKVIVVNSFFDELSEKEFKQIAESNNADFFSVPNNGYGAGNNSGIEFAIKHYRFRYLIISNADIIIKKLDKSLLKREFINAPSIKTLKGKNQNPHTPFYVSLLERLRYKAYAKDSRFTIYFTFGINKILRVLFWGMYKVLGYNSIHAPHGAFIIIPYDFVLRLHPLFNPDMFLYIEENHLAMKARKEGIPIVYNDQISITHKEDGSINMAVESYGYKTMKQSFQTYYEYWKQNS